MRIQIKPVVRQAENIEININVAGGTAYATYNLFENNINIAGHLVIDGPEYDNWGTDDNYMYDLILQKLGFERA